jgi:hypothetical protein
MYVDAVDGMVRWNRNKKQNKLFNKDAYGVSGLANRYILPEEDEERSGTLCICWCRVLRHI